jgi:hypothetical protein
MARPKKKLNVLLIEPNYSNKYPPIGLMKIASYHRSRGHNVVFYKGDLRNFVIERICDKCIKELEHADESIKWFLHKKTIFDFIKTRKKDVIQNIPFADSFVPTIAEQIVIDAKDYYWKKLWQANPEWDRVFVTTLFTFYWDITVETINFAKLLVKKEKDLMVGGVLASLQSKEIYEATGIKPFVGVMDRPGILDKGDTAIIDDEPLDYSILDEIEYKYPMSNAYYGYMTRGCIRHCPFCAVPTLEPKYNAYIPLKQKIERTAALYGDQKDLLLMDNNVLASDNLAEIIKEIRESGFAKHDTLVAPNPLIISIRNLADGLNDRAYLRKSHSLMMEFYAKLKGSDSSDVYSVLKEFHVYDFSTVTKENLLMAYEKVKDTLNKTYKAAPRQRYIDFNQGVDARLFTPEKAELLASIAIRPLRIAFDNLKTVDAYLSAIRMSAKAGIKDFSNYLLYNFTDKPIELYQRLLINVKLCDELNVNIYSFPMKFHPIRKGNENSETDFSHNRDYIGTHWNRKYIRAIQAILNSTKGKVGKGLDFFYKAFGNTEEEFCELLEMPETFILYRFFFEWLDEQPNGLGTTHWRNAWKNCKSNLSEDEWQRLLDYIHLNTFTEDENAKFTGECEQELLNFYTNYRKDIVTPGTKLYELKQQYDKHPTIELRRKKIM